MLIYLQENGLISWRLELPWVLSLAALLSHELRQDNDRGLSRAEIIDTFWSKIVLRSSRLLLLCQYVLLQIRYTRQKMTVHIKMPVNMPRPSMTKCSNKV